MPADTRRADELAAAARAHAVSLTLKAVWWADAPAAAHPQYLSHTVFVREGCVNVSLSQLRQALESMGLVIADDPESE